MRAVTPRYTNGQARSTPHSRSWFRARRRRDVRSPSPRRRPSRENMQWSRRRCRRRARSSSSSGSPVLARGNRRDLDRVLGKCELRFDARACRCVALRHPRVPHTVHFGEAAIVGQPDARGYDPALVEPHAFEQPVDLVENLTGLSGHVERRVVRHLARDESQPACDHQLAHPFTHAISLDLHHLTALRGRVELGRFKHCNSPLYTLFSEIFSIAPHWSARAPRLFAIFICVHKCMKKGRFFCHSQGFYDSSQPLENLFANDF
ncbi:hypothetical protein BO443_190120 [Burkholderia orbicola]